MSRSNRIIPSISRADYFENKNKRSEVESEFVKEMEKSAVKSKEKDQSLFDQINSIVGNKRSKYQSVEAAVEDMRKRSGLLDYLKLQAQKEEKLQTKKANISTLEEPQIFKKAPAVKNTIHNYITDTRGNMSVPAIIEKAKYVHKKDGLEDSDFEDPAFISYVTNLNFAEKGKTSTDHNNSDQLGKLPLDNNDIDQGNTDAWIGLMPNKK